MADLNRINLIMGETDGVYHDAALRLGLSDSAMRILYALRTQENACDLSLLPRLTGMTKQTINSSLRKLEQAQILLLSAAEGRKKRVLLTEKGQLLAGQSIDRLMALESAIFDSWPEQDMQLFLDLNQRYLTQLREKIKEL